ncbi:hypothetical protein ACGFIK_14945 [Micromonospora sp. NPDC048871]|uniref:hypothetical protein n=1 Tax=Micromonospora sp. NPDC048871 TaxID=3364259 RepID=UPI00371F1C62
MGEDRRHIRLSLATLDSLGSDEELREQVTLALRRAESDRRPSTHSGQDPTGAITVVVDSAGQVEDVTVTRDWRSRVGVSGAPEALFTAYTTAVQAAVETVALRQLRADSNEAARPQPNNTGEAASTSEVGPDDEQWLRQTWQTLHDLDIELEGLARPPQMVSEQEVASPSGVLTLRMRDGGVVSIVGDVRRIAQLDAAALRYEAHALFRTYALVRSQNRP